MQATPFEPAPSGTPGVPITLESLLQGIAELEQNNSKRHEAERDLAEPLACAATLAEFEPLPVLAAFGMAANAGNELRLLAYAKETNRAGSTPTGWRLTQAARRQALTAVGSSEALRALRRRVDIAAPGTLQRMADLLLDGAPLPPSLAIGELAALVEAHGWYQGILPHLPEIHMLHRRLAMAQLLEPMQRLVGAQFVGRKHELERLADYVGILQTDGLLASIGASARRFVRRARRSLLSDPPLFVVGLGGVGKSSLMARFILDHVDPARTDSIPFVLVDFDDSLVEPRLPLSLLLAALQQLRVQFPAHESSMARMSESLARQMRSSDAAEYTKSYSLQQAVVADFARQVDSMLGGPEDPTPLLWVLDTFEEPQRMGDSTVGPLWELMNTLQQHLPRLRLVVCGRVAPSAFPWDLVTLEEFDPPSAKAYLRQRLVQIGASERADDATLARVIALVGRSPLALRLAARLVAEEDGQLLMLKVRSARVLGVLFHRVLEHVRVHQQLDANERVDAEECARLQTELGRVVFPGLVVRRVTPGVIRHVLAKPCGVALRDAGHADRLFKALRQQVDIVDSDSDEDGEASLMHRGDLRRMMLRDIETKAGARMVEQIARRAVRYHQAFNTPSHRAEEVYHRLRLVQAEATIRARWQPELKPYLLSALDEIEGPAMRLLLASLLGVTLDADTLKNAAQDDWEHQTAQRAAEYLRAGSPESALEVLRERAERLPASPLLGLEAQACHLLGDFSQAAALARRAFDESAQAGDMAAACDAALLLARELNALLDADTLRKLRHRPALLRELLAELAAVNRPLLATGIDVLGVDLPSPDDAYELATTLQLWVEQTVTPEVARDTLRSFGVATGANAPMPTHTEWADWLWQSGSDRSARLLLELLRTQPPGEAVLARLQGLYQREVQRRIVRVEAMRSL